MSARPPAALDDGWFGLPETHRPLLEECKQALCELLALGRAEAADRERPASEAVRLKLRVEVVH